MAKNALISGGRLGEQSLDDIWIPGLKLIQEIGRGGSSVVYLAERTTPSGKTENYAVKIIKSGIQKDSPFLLPRLRKEAGVLSRIDHPCLVKIMEIGEVGHRSYMVMQYVDGESIVSSLKQHKFNEQSIIYLAVRLASALQEIQKHGLVHCDIKPHNILIDEAGEIKLVDFGLAAELNDVRINHEVVGTCIYTSPEQAGVLNRPIDGRSDLYSLGVVLFEACTGRVPFFSKDVGELIHQHASIVPPEVVQINPEISPAFSKIIAKLLAKDPDDRYDSGYSLITDLENLDQLNAALAAAEEVVFGSADAYEHNYNQTQIVGREVELTKMLEFWKEIRTSGGGVMLITGDSGCGKTRLVDEFASLVRKTNATILLGKASSANPIPFVAFRNAIDAYIDRSQRLPSKARATVEHKVRKAMGDFAPLIKQFSHRIAKLFPNIPDLVDATHVQEQFYEAIADLFLNIATRAEPIVLILRDIQWLDEGSYQVLKHLIKKINSAPFCILCTSRSDQGNVITLEQLLENSENQKGVHVPLGLLSLESTKKLISAHLGNGAVDDNLTQQIYSRTQGNPLAIEHFLGAILNEGLLQPHWGSWILDTEGLKKLALPSDLAQLIIRRVEKLTPSTKHTLGVAGVFGSHFDLTSLQEVCRKREEEILRAIMEATAVNLIELDEKGEYVFVHDRAREILISQFDGNSIKVLHRTIAESLDRYQGGNEPDFVFKLANHFNLGEPEKSSQRVYDVNFLAGKRAIEKNADEDAYNHFQCAARIALNTVVVENIELEEYFGDLCIRMGLLDEGIQHFEKVMKFLIDPTKRARICGKLTAAWLYNGSAAQSWAYTRQAFRELALPIPKRSSFNISFAAAEYVKNWILGKVKVFLSRKVSQEDSERARILASIANSTKLFGFFQGKIGIALNLALRTMHCRGEISPSRELVYFHMFHALFLAVLGNKSGSKASIDQAILVAKQQGDPIALSRSMFYRALCYFTFGEERNATALSLVAIRDHLHWSMGDDYVMLTVCHHMTYLLRGKTVDLLELNENTLGYCTKKAGQTYKENIGFLLSFRMAGLSVAGRTGEAVASFKKAEEYFKDRTDYVSQYLVNMFCQAMFYLEQGETGVVVDQLIGEHEKKGPHYRTDMIDACGFYIPKAYLRFAQWSKASEEFKNVRYQQLLAALKDLKRVSRTPLMEGHRLTLLAMIYRAKGHLRYAGHLLNRVEKIAYEVDSPWLFFEIARNRAELFRKYENKEAAFTCAQFAMNIALAQGWESKIFAIKSEYYSDDHPLQIGMRNELFSALLGSRSKGNVTRESILLKRNMSALLELAMASVNVLEPQMQTEVALREIIRLLGAERALLFLTRDDSNEVSYQAGQDSEGKHLGEPVDYSRTVVAAVRMKKEPLVYNGTNEGEPLLSESIMVHNLRSIIATPLLMKDRFIGVLYLDSRVAKGIFSEEDVEIFRALGNHVAIAIETARTAQLEFEKKALQKDLELTRAVQSFLLPKVEDYVSKSLVMSAFLQPAAQVGGDWWWFEQREDGTLRIFVGDVTGHGAGSAMVTAIIASSYRTLQVTNRNSEIPEILRTLHQVLVDLCGGSYWMTMSAVEINPNEGQIRWWNACAPELFLVKEDGRIEVIEPETQVPLSPLGSEELIIGCQQVPFKSGEKLLIFTDGLFEFKTADGQEFGLRRLKNLFAQAGGDGSPQRMRDLVHQIAKELTERGDIEDDLTFVAVKKL